MFHRWIAVINLALVACGSPMEPMQGTFALVTIDGVVVPSLLSRTATDEGTIDLIVVSETLHLNAGGTAEVSRTVETRTPTDTSETLSLRSGSWTAVAGLVTVFLAATNESPAAEVDLRVLDNGGLRTVDWRGANIALNKEFEYARQ